MHPGDEAIHQGHVETKEGILSFAKPLRSAANQMLLQTRCHYNL